jgi:outer membrane protein assembly factor BamB
LHRAGPALACFDAADGKVIWTSKVEPEKWVVGDPLLIQDELFALVMTRLEQELTLSLSTFDPQSGAVLRSRPLIRLHEPWWQQRTCQVAAAGDALIVACGGTVLSCDLFGEVRWVRRQLWLPPSLDRSWVAQSQDPPLLADGRLFVAQPGVRSVAALEPESGRLIWRSVLPAVRRVVGHAENLLLVETDAGFTALDAGSGKPLWQHEANPRLDAVLLGGAGGLLYAKSAPVPGEKAWRAVLVWVDLATGRTRSQAPLESLKHEHHDWPKLGPLWMSGERRFAFFGRGDQDASRDIVEIAPRGAAVEPNPSSGLEVWNRNTDPALRAAAASVFPDWSLVGGRSDAQTGIQALFLEEKNLLSTLTGVATRPLEMVQHVAFPAGSSPKLRLRVANDPQGKWKLEVRADGQNLLEQTIDQAFTGGTWKDLEVDLKPLAGRPVWLVVRQVDLGGAQPYAKWKRLELVP